MRDVLKDFVEDDKELVFLETLAGTFLYAPALGTFRNFKVIGDFHGSFVLGSWPIYPEQADDIDTAFYTGEYVLTRRREDGLWSREVVFTPKEQSQFFIGKLATA